MDLFSSVEEVEKEFCPEEFVCSALLLQFKKPIVYDLSIPDEHSIPRLVKLGAMVLGGEQVPVASVNCCFPNLNAGNCLVPKNLIDVFADKKIAEELFNVLRSSREDYNRLEDFLSYEILFRRESPRGFGHFYEFRTGSRELFQRAVEKHFSETQQKDFQNLGKAFQPYVARINSSCPAKF